MARRRARPRQRRNPVAGSGPPDAVGPAERRPIRSSSGCPDDRSTIRPGAARGGAVRLAAARSTASRPVRDREPEGATTDAEAGPDAGPAVQAASRPVAIRSSCSASSREPGRGQVHLPARGSRALSARRMASMATARSSTCPSTGTMPGMRSIGRGEVGGGGEQGGHGGAWRRPDRGAARRSGEGSRRHGRSASTRRRAGTDRGPVRARCRPP